jgi:bacillithiol biosynthesis cysteine-adding enzyme BshC
MQSTATHLTYSKTNSFSSLVLDYLSGQDDLKIFYKHAPSVEGVKAAMRDRKLFNNNRSLLVNALKNQYKDIALSSKQEHNLKLLEDENTFTICTAHQPNIFTGHLYFIYKILHAVKIAEDLAGQIRDSNFVPVYYMGSEDADLEELGHIFINGQKYEWKTNQTGAVGRMKVDKALLQLIESFSGQLTVLPHGKAIVDLMRNCYTLNTTIEQATLKLVNELFAAYGLLVLLPDSRELKSAFIPVMEKELLEGFSHQAVAATVEALPPKYKAQASGREINLFYLKDNSRERIELINGEWSIVNSETRFSREEILKELHQYPERFSPNVILRPVFQETILPGIVFIGGGGEVAYWMELKKVFEAVAVPYPILVLRNSFLLVEKDDAAIIRKLRFSYEELFMTEFDLMNKLVKRDSSTQVTLEKERDQLLAYYDQLKSIAGKVDTTLQPHTEALYAKALKKINELEKKLLRAEKRKFEAEQRQLKKIKANLFPNNSLQERIENFMSFYGKWGNDLLKTIYDNSLSLQQEFVIIEEQ